MNRIVAIALALLFLPALATAQGRRADMGANGGYMLVKDPEDVTIYDIVYSMQGFIAPVGCVEDICSCNKTNGCVTRMVWNTLTESISDTLKSFTLADLIAKHKESHPALEAHDAV